MIGSHFRATLHALYMDNVVQVEIKLLHQKVLPLLIILPHFARHINSHLHYDYPCYYLPLLQH